MLLDRSHPNFTIVSLKQHMKYFYFRGKIPLDHPVVMSSSSMHH